MKRWSTIGRASFLLLSLGTGALGCSSSGGPVAPSDGGPSSADASQSVDGAPDSAGASNDAGVCVPCTGTGPGMYLTCTQVKDPSPGAVQGAQVDLPAAAQADGTCLLGAVTLACGGTGTFADGTPLTWTLSQGVVTFEDSTRVFTCTLP